MRILQWALGGVIYGIEGIEYLTVGVLDTLRADAGGLVGVIDHDEVLEAVQTNTVGVTGRPWG
jgi:hypothetical protein